MIPLPPNKYDGFIFDCDGTLAHSMPLHFRAWTETLARKNGGVSPFSEEVFYSLGGMHAMKIVEWLNREYHLTFPVEETFHEKEQRYLELLPEVQPVPAVVATVKAIGKREKMIIASGSPRHIVKMTLQHLGLESYFQGWVTPEDVVHGKPAPDIFLRAAAILGVAPARCVVFEDGPPGFAGARAAGMDFIDVRPYY